MQKSIFSFLLSLVCAFLIISCTEDKVYRIGVSQCSDDDWRQKMNAEIRRELMFHPEAMVEIRSADDSSQKQIEDIRYFVDNDFDIIIAAPNEADALTPVISDAYSQGIPVVLFDRNIHGDSYTAWQGTDNKIIGNAVARYVIVKAGVNAKVIEIEGLESSTPAEERNAGFTAVGGIDVVARGFGNWNYDDAYRVADSLLAIYPDVDVIFAHNDRMAIAASDAARMYGLDPFIVGIDGAPEIGLKAVDSGVIDATFLYPTEGQRLVRTALAILEGQPFDKYTYLPVTPPVDSINADILLFQNESLKEETVKMEMLKEEMDEYWSKHTSQTAMFYAVLVIVILLFGLLFLLLRAFWQHRRHQKALLEQNRLLQDERDKQKVLNERLDAAMSSKLAFFTNVSHDLRTPLTLISEPVEQMAQSDNIDDREKFLMNIARKNVHVLLRLINQILDFRKYESDKLELNQTETDLVGHIREWSEAFVALAGRRNIAFRINLPQNGAKLAFDVEKMERVFYNLVSNAFKYTPDGGSISVTLTRENDSVVLKVEDSGRGISTKDLPNVFDRFFQGERIHSSGTGIGLALAKAFVELHNGTIDVESTVGEGTTFTVILPVVHVSNEVAAPEISPKITSETVDTEHGIFNHRNDVTVNPDQPLILVIDDNADICALLSELLSDRYVVITAVDAAEGLRLAEKYVPDLIICDVMMPGMNGLECCRRLKSDVATSHIPVLMLTACTMDEQRADGYEVGADGYLPKPFNSAVLTARVKNLIESRQQIRKLWKEKGAVQQQDSENIKNNVPEAGVAEPEAQSESGKMSVLGRLTALESQFYARFLKIFTERMSDPDLSIETIASEMGLGYSQLYRKIKALTNYRPVELMRLLRLEKAREMMKNTEKTISEISYEVGFSNPAYFTKCYRDLYGETPTDTRSAG